MRYGYWLPVFGGWLRNVDDEQMEVTGLTTATWRGAARKLVTRPDADRRVELERHQGSSEAPSLAAVTKRLELMVAVRPTFHQPALLAKQAALAMAS